MIFKIYGERNSGTNFLARLLKSNFGDKNVFVDHLDLNTSICYYWKHGYPDNQLTLKKDKIIEIFIVRDFYKWLVSMYYNPYCLGHANEDVDFETFLVKRNTVEKKSSLSLNKNNIPKIFIRWFYSLSFNYTSTSNIKNNHLRSFLNNKVKFDRLFYPFPTNYLRDHKHKNYLNFSDQSKNIFEIRYDKLRSYFSYGLSKDCIFILLDDIQDKSKCKLFLDKLSYDFNLNRKKLDLIERNLKTYSLSKNTKYNLNIEPYKDLISGYYDNDLENHFKNLSYLKK